MTSNTPGTLTINKVALTVTVANASEGYGSALADADRHGYGSRERRHGGHDAYGGRMPTTASAFRSLQQCGDCIRSTADTWRQFTGQLQR